MYKVSSEEIAVIKKRITKNALHNRVTVRVNPGCTNSKSILTKVLNS